MKFFFLKHFLYIFDRNISSYNWNSLHIAADSWIYSKEIGELLILKGADIIYLNLKILFFIKKVK